MDNNKNAIETPEEQIARLEEEKKALKKENRRLRSELGDAQRKANEHAKTINDITSSRSWKVTALLRKIGALFLLFKKGLAYLKLYGFKATFNRVFRHKPVTISPLGDIDEYNVLNLNIRREQERAKFKKKIKFSVIVPLYNTPKELLTEMIESVQAQTYKDWELCLADGSDDEHSFVGEMVADYMKKDKRIVYKKLTENKGISENTNACLEMATGDYLALFDHDDLLHPEALYKYMEVICDKDADFIYCDEDKFTHLGEGFYDANFKPDFAPDNLRSNNYICHFTVFSRKLYEQVGGFRKEFDGSQDHDIILRLTEKAEHIVHIPLILYHWRISDASVASDPYAKPYTIKAGINAVSEHLERVGLKGTVESSPIHPNIYRIRYEIENNPKISILIPNYNHVEELKTCIDSIRDLSTYENYEIIIIENNSNEETFEYYKELEKDERIKVVVYKPEAGFNYSAINNFGVNYASGDYLLFLNNDVEIITPDWMEEMLMLCQRNDVGATGAKLYYPDDTIQHAGVILGVLTLAGHAFKGNSRNDPGYFGRASYQQDLTACTAACLMVRKNVFDEIGGFDESLAVAFNDIDLCMKIRKAGYLVTFTPYAELYHYESKSRGMEDTPEKIKRFQGEIKRFHEKWQYALDAGDPYYNPNLTLEREDFSIKRR